MENKEKILYAAIDGHPFEGLNEEQEKIVLSAMEEYAAQWKLKYNELKAENEKLNDALISDAVRLEYNFTGCSYSDLLKEHAALKDRAQKLVDALEMAVKQWQDQYNAECSHVDWYNNNMPGVGQTIDYKIYPKIPEWVNSTKAALASWNEGKEGKV